MLLKTRDFRYVLHESAYPSPVFFQLPCRPVSQTPYILHLVNLYPVGFRILINNSDFEKEVPLKC